MPPVKSMLYIPTPRAAVATRPRAIRITETAMQALRGPMKSMLVLSISFSIVTRLSQPWAYQNSKITRET